MSNHDDRLSILIDLLKQRQQLIGSFESSAPVGSSASKRSGFVIIARATATRCFWPPDNS